MSDFFQAGAVTTLHRLSHDGPERLEKQIEALSRAHPAGLILPALYSEFEHPAMRGIVDELREARWLRRIAVAVGQATPEQYQRACGFFRGFKAPVTTIWMEDPRIEDLFTSLDRAGLSPGSPGKGRTCWLAIGYLLAEGDCEIIALHDCDIRHYDRDLLARLVFPVAHPSLDYDFSKGYYARASGALYGRVKRLFFTPLIRAIRGLTSEPPLVRFLDSFRYALSGEYAMKTRLARAMRIPGNWGMEVGILAEVHRNCLPSRVCEVDLCDNYEHKHRPLCPDEPGNGLRRMTREIASSLFHSMAREGVALSREVKSVLLLRYEELARDAIRRYRADAILNGLDYDEDTENRAVHAFAESLRESSAEFEATGGCQPQEIPSWNRVQAAFPDIFERLLELSPGFAPAPRIYAIG